MEEQIFREKMNYAMSHAKAIIGYSINIDSWRNVTGLRIVTLQRTLLILGGPDVIWEPVKDDENPPRFYEPLPSGPWKGRTTDRELVERKRLTYFETLGWDEKGIPKAETLQRLGLEDLELSMNGFRV